MKLGLTGKNVLITGATQGIGWATARAFLEEGSRVFLNGRSDARLQEKCQKLKKYSEMVIPCVADVTLADDIAGIVKRIETYTSHIDVAVMNVGTGKPLSANSLDIREWRRFYEVNTISAVEVLNALHPLLKNGHKASVILISSVVARERSTAPIGYAAAKSAVLELNRYLAGKWATDNIRVNCVLPGNIFFPEGRWAEILRQDEEGTKNYIAENVPLSRFGTPEEIADAIIFLASERASFITGATLNIDGGQQKAI